MYTKRRSPFESPSRHLVGRRKAVRCVRNVLIVGAVLVALVDQVGEPLLRWEYRYRRGDPNRTPVSATYIGLSGRYASCQLCRASGHPVVLFSRPNPSLWQQGTAQVRSLLP